jgi:hypothetical protein
MKRPLIQKRLGALGLAAILAAGCATPPAEKAAAMPPAPGNIEATAPQPDAVELPDTVEDPGIRVESLRLTAADYMLDLRFRITDPERAAPFFSRKTNLELVDEASGARLEVPNTPKLGRLRQVARKDATDRSYFMLFANPGRYLKAGSQVTLVAGDTRIGQLTVE